LSYLLYSFLFATGMLLTLPYWLYQIVRHGKYGAGFSERLGRVPERLWAGKSRFPQQRVIWVHAVSLGEVLAVSRLIEEMRKTFPEHRIVISTTTDTGQNMARKRFGEENVFYFPMDLGFAIRSYLRALQPELIVLAETEFWPNFLHLAHGNGCRIAVVNARISDRSWPRYRRFRWALRRMLAHIDLFLTQTPEDGSRLQAIGAESGRVQRTGNLKFDVIPSPPPPIVDQLGRSLAGEHAGPVLVCGSTVEDEEALLLRAFENVLVEHSRAVMILAPRHPERFDDVAILLQQLNIRHLRRSRWHGEPLAGCVLLLDSIGELTAVYSLATVAFVGGSLVPRGGHNIIEPALYGVAIVVGNHTENFRDIVALFRRNDAVRIVSVAELPLTLMHLLADEEERRALGNNAQETMRSQAGVTAQTVKALKGLLAGDRNHSLHSPREAQTD
jgi:3-deoxy-D-manno-octulosonic-acid transferase